jgi:hypothetical protein
VARAGIVNGICARKGAKMANKYLATLKVKEKGFGPIDYDSILVEAPSEREAHSRAQDVARREYPTASAVVLSVRLTDGPSPKARRR